MEEKEQEKQDKLRRLGLAVGCTIGGIGAGIMVLALPFVSPAFRKFALPYVPATSVQLETVQRFLRGRRGKVVDLGSGDGRVVINLAKEGHYSVGYELNIWLVLYSKCKALFAGVHQNTQFHRKDLWKVDLSGYENIVIFGVESMMEPLGEKIKKEASPTTKIITCRFSLPGWTPTDALEAGHNSVWMYDNFHH